MTTLDRIARISMAAGAAVALSLTLPDIGYAAKDSLGCEGPTSVMEDEQAQADRVDLDALAKKLKAAVKAGKLTEEEARAKWEVILKKVKGKDKVGNEGKGKGGHKKIA